MSATSIASQVSMAAAPSPACSSLPRQHLSSSQKWEPSSSSTDWSFPACHVAATAGGGRRLRSPSSSGLDEVLAGGRLDTRSARADTGSSRTCHVAVSLPSVAKKSVFPQDWRRDHRRNTPGTFRVESSMVLSQQIGQQGAPCTSKLWPQVNCFTENRFRHMSPPLSSPKKSLADEVGRDARQGGISGVRRTRSLAQAKPDGGELTLQLQAHKVNKLTAKELDTLLLSEREVPVVIDFYATWCGPCLILAQELDRLALEYGESVLFVKVDTDQETDLASQLQIRGLPTMVFVSQDKSKNAMRVEGFLPTSEIKRIIDQEL